MSEPIETLFLESRTPKLPYDIRKGIEPALLCIHSNSRHRGLWGLPLRRLPDYAALRMVDVDGQRLAASDNDQKR